MREDRTCPCCSGESYARCCRGFHLKRTLPSTAEQLMRSRYSAYALGLVDYIVATTDPDGPMWEANRHRWKRAIEAFSREADFRDLRIEASEALSEHTATVTFTASLSSGDRDLSFREKSLFYRKGGQWLYHSGERV